MVKKLTTVLGTGFLALAVLMALQPAARANTDVLALEGLGPAFGSGSTGVYLSPYTISVNGHTVTMLSCDDYEGGVPASWSAAVNSINNGAITGVDFPNAADIAPDGGVLVTFPGTTPVTADYTPVVAYEAAGFLAAQIMYGNLDFTNLAEYSFALWQLFDPSAYLDMNTDLADYYSADQTTINAYDTAVAADMASAFSEVAAGGANLQSLVSNLEVFTPVPGAGYDYSTTQEFLGFSGQPDLVPEASGVSFLAFDLLALFGGIFLVQKRVLS